MTLFSVAAGRPVWAAGLVAWLIGGLAGCSAPTERQRVDFTLNAQGQCSLARQPVACAQAGAQATQGVPAERISAVLLIDPQAPAEALTALRQSLQAAHIQHVQYGDPANQKVDPKATIAF